MSKKTKIAIVLTVFGILIVIIIVVAVILLLSIRSIGTNSYGLLHKKGEDKLLKSNKTYTSGMKWAGIGNDFHQFEITEYSGIFKFSVNASDELVPFSVSTAYGLDEADLYLMWYSLYSEPSLMPVQNVTAPIFKRYLDTLDKAQIKSNDTTVKKNINIECTNKFRSILQDNVHVVPTSCECLHGKEAIL